MDGLKEGGDAEREDSNGRRGQGSKWEGVRVVVGPLEDGG